MVEHGRSGKVTIARKVNGAIGRVTPFDAQISRLAGLPAEAALPVLTYRQSNCR